MNIHAQKAILRISKCTKMLADEVYRPDKHGRPEALEIATQIDDKFVDILELINELLELGKFELNDPASEELADTLFKITEYALEHVEAFLGKSKQRSIEDIPDEELAESIDWIQE